MTPATGFEVRPEGEATTQTDLRRRVYDASSLERYPFRKRILIRAAASCFYWLIAIIGRTLRWTIADWHYHDELKRSEPAVIYAFWHNRVALATWFWRRRGIVVMTSRSSDGEYIARFIQRFGYGAARGSASRGGAQALLQMAACLRENMDVAFTIDGPRGPVYVAKRGAVRLAHMTGTPILPVSLSAEHFWTVRSWDRFQIPRPFTRALLMLGEPIRVAPGSDSATLAARQSELQAALDGLRARGDRWWAERPAST